MYRKDWSVSGSPYNAVAAMALPTRRRHSMTPKPHLRAFSLLELLITISIIGLLVAIVLPALSGARLHGKRVVCLANLHTLGQTVEMYLQHYGPTYPNVDPFPMGPQFPLSPQDALDITQHGACLPVRLHPLLPNAPTLISETWYCPVKGAIDAPQGLRRFGHGTYPFNAGTLASKNTWRIKNPPHTGLVRDFVALDMLNEPNGELRYGLAHKNGQNILYLDSHAEFDTHPEWLVWGPTDMPAFPN